MPVPQSHAALRAERVQSIPVLMLSPRIAKGAMKVSIVVGTVLNAINNGEQLWGDHEIHPVGIALNYVVPLCVSAYSAARNESQRRSQPKRNEPAV